MTPVPRLDNGNRRRAANPEGAGCGAFFNAFSVEVTTSVLSDSNYLSFYHNIPETNERARQGSRLPRVQGQLPLVGRKPDTAAEPDRF